MSISPHAMLSNGSYLTWVNSDGAGYSCWGDYALTRWRDDRIEPGEGFFIYLRDPDIPAVWSVGRQPVPVESQHYETRFDNAHIEITHTHQAIEANMIVTVAAADDLEIRTLTLHNHADRGRRIELTSYAELVLNAPVAETAHPAFSKLFVQTEFIPQRAALVATRRPREAHEATVWAFHAAAAPDADSSLGPPQYETDRMRFLGRGRSLTIPRALGREARLSNTTGSVLDPVFGLRRVVELGPGETTRVMFTLGAAATRGEVLALATRYGESAAIEAAFHGAAENIDPPPERPAVDPTDRLPTVHQQAKPQAGRLRSSSGRPSLTHGTGQPPECLRFDNGYGGFSQDGKEYVIRLTPDVAGDLVRPPLPWINVVANETTGFLISEAGAGYTWSRNSRERRLTPWYNDPVTDPHGEALYIRDEHTGACWSPLPGPLPDGEAYEARHGFGYSRFKHISQGLEQHTTLFVPRRDDLKITRLRLTNHTDTTRHVRVFNYNRLVLGETITANAPYVVTEFDAHTHAIFARNPVSQDCAERIAFAAVFGPGGAPADQYTADRAGFIGQGRSPNNPRALYADTPLDAGTGARLDPCAAFSLAVEIPVGETIECCLLLGEAEDRAAARGLIERYRTLQAIDEALQQVHEFWSATLGALRIETPVPEIDVMVNGWLVYQNLSCRLWARSAFYQPGGAFGFRDQLQDSAALVYAQPERTRAQILLHAAHQFVEGDVLHWWHPSIERGVRTRFSDDLLWLPYVTAFYLDTTGDDTLLDQRVPFITARELDNGEHEALLDPVVAEESASLFEHCCRALDRSLTQGAHGLPLMGTGDWNDGMNRVGCDGQGESVWLGFFMVDILNRFLPYCIDRADRGRIEQYRAYRARLITALNDAGWDGNWYRRAFYDDGAPLGSATNEEGRIDAIAQAWSVISGAAPAGRVELAMDALEQYLVSEPDGLIHLLWPPFDETVHDPGYIKGYPPGIRENGGQYTHGVLWAIRAMAECGRGERAAALLEMLSPISHTRTPPDVAVYQTEPYAVAADVYGVPPYAGRGGWSWYTGAAGWMYRVALESVLGFTIEQGKWIVLRPRAPATWRSSRIHYRPPGMHASYEIAVRSDMGEGRRRKKGAAVIAATLDGTPLEISAGIAYIPLLYDGTGHAVTVTIGDRSAAESG